MTTANMNEMNEKHYLWRAEMYAGFAEAKKFEELRTLIPQIKYFSPNEWVMLFRIPLFGEDCRPPDDIIFQFPAIPGSKFVGVANADSIPYDVDLTYQCIFRKTGDIGKWFKLPEKMDHFKINKSTGGLELQKGEDAR